MKFSERKGITPVPKLIQIEEMSNELRISIWNCLDLYIWSGKDFLWSQYNSPGIKDYSAALWFSFFKKPIDRIPESSQNTLKEIRDFFFSCEWYEVYNFLEFTLNHFKTSNLKHFMNLVLERELSGYRFIGNCISDITNEHEVEMLESVLKNTDFPTVSAHIKRALELLSDRKNPDYRNSIKESISAVESLAKIIAKKPKTTLGDALKELEKKKKIHPSLKDGFSKIYGYTNDEGGIRHALMEESDLTAADAKFFLISCSSFINYLKSKLPN